jgi:LmbE family N-acetylglucosaminyl deacetylase
MGWIYLSPHFDDAVLSCGGLIWEQASRGEDVEIWTVCAGPIPPGPLSPFAAELHARWGTGLASVGARRAEDEAACRAVGAVGRYFDLPDSIYRRLPGSGAALVTRRDDLWLPYPAAEEEQAERIASWILRSLPRRYHLVCPLGVGGHLDHRLVRAAVERLKQPLWYYADYPYVVKEAFEPRRWLGPGYCVYSRFLRPPALNAWRAGVAAYASQISSFWSGLAEMEQAIAAFATSRPGHSLWRK